MYPWGACMKSLLSWLFYILSGWMPRDRTLWVFGTNNGAFADNSKYLFIHVAQTRPHIRAIWISHEDVTIERLRLTGYEAYSRSSWKGRWYCLRAKYYFVASYITDINFFLSRGAVHVNLWHGTPLKKIEFDIRRGPLARYFVSPSLKTRLIDRPGLYKKPDFVLSASSYVSSYSLSSAFRIPLYQCINLGYPRNDALFSPRSALLDQIRQLGEIELANHLDAIVPVRRLILYLPTWRDSGAAATAKTDIDWPQLNAVMQAHGAMLLAKPHPNVSADASGLPGSHEFENIAILAPNVDIYPFMGLADVLVTDYSSVIFDFCLTLRPIIITTSDVEHYQNEERELYMPLEAVQLGTVVRNQEQLIATLHAILNNALPNYSENTVDKFNSFRGPGAAQRVADYFVSR
jgi:CDP-glycerol glycerophosphotransferase (TagB/SpsB family)